MRWAANKPDKNQTSDPYRRFRFLSTFRKLSERIVSKLLELLFRYEKKLGSNYLPYYSVYIFFGQFVFKFIGFGTVFKLTGGYFMYFFTVYHFF
jgi:hypothetical protein